MDTSLPSTPRSIVVFGLGEGLYGIDVRCVKEIMRPLRAVPVPGTAQHVRGLVNLRGRTLPVVDLRLRLGLEPISDADGTRIVVVEGDRGAVGLVVDTVVEVAALTLEEAPPPSDAESTFLKGIATHCGDLVAVLDIEQTLAA